MPHTHLSRLSALVLLVLLATACSSTSPSSSAPADGPGSAAASADASVLSALVLEVGDCFITDDVSTVDAVTVVDCDAGHVYEVFGLSDYDAADDADFPGDDALSSAADDACRPSFEDYVGVSFDRSEWFGTFINPSPETWANGDREIVCVLHTEDETQVIGSARGSNR